MTLNWNDLDPALQERITLQDPYFKELDEANQQRINDEWAAMILEMALYVDLRKEREALNKKIGNRKGIDPKIKYLVASMVFLWFFFTALGVMK